MVGLAVISPKSGLCEFDALGDVVRDTFHPIDQIVIACHRVWDRLELINIVSDYIGR